MALSILSDIGVAKDQINLIGTDFQSSGDLTRKDVALHLKSELNFSLPHADEAILTSINTGDPLVLSEPTHVYSQAIEALAKHLLQLPQDAAPSLNQPPVSLQQKLQSRGWF
jgi:MinD-like ATPase involved in chromosome partitioning or flagellar assembly